MLDHIFRCLWIWLDCPTELWLCIRLVFERRDTELPRSAALREY